MVELRFRVSRFRDQPPITVLELWRDGVRISTRERRGCESGVIRFTGDLADYVWEDILEIFARGAA